jgi:hypothetical protein
MRIPNKYNGYSADNRRLYNDPVSAAVVANAMAAGAGTLGTAAAAAAPAIAAGTAAAAPLAAAAVPLAATAAVPAAASAAIPGLISSAAPALAGQAATVAAPSAIPGLIGGASPVFSAAANPLTTAMSTGASGFPLTPGGVSAAQPSFFDSFKGFAKENPMLTQMGFSTAKDVLTPDQINPAPIVPVQSRGKLAAYDPISFMNPYQQTVISNQPISLL